VRLEARSTVWLRKNEKKIELIRNTEQNLQNVFVSDASDSHAYIYKADGQFQYVKDFELTDEEKTTSSGCRELLAVQKTLQDSPGQFEDHKGGTVFWQTDSKNCYSFLMRGSRKPEIQRIVMDIKSMERSLDIIIVPVRTPRTQARIVTADLGSKLSSSTDEWCIDREDLANVFGKLKYKPEVDCMATRTNAICEKFFSKIPQISSKGVNFLAQSLETSVCYYYCPPSK
jgi:hypothetical protein